MSYRIIAKKFGEGLKDYWIYKDGEFMSLAAKREDAEFLMSQMEAGNTVSQAWGALGRRRKSGL